MFQSNQKTATHLMDWTFGKNKYGFINRFAQLRHRFHFDEVFIGIHY